MKSIVYDLSNPTIFSVFFKYWTNYYGNESILGKTSFKIIEVLTIVYVLQPQ